MRALLSYPYTGEDKQRVARLLAAASEGLRTASVEPVCLALDFAATSPQRSAPRLAMEAAFELMRSVDLLLVLQSSERRSEGMLMEVGYALALGIPVVVATHADVTRTYVPDMATAAMRWTTFEDLSTQLGALNYHEAFNEATARPAAR